jgi:hypothetical protein
MGQDIALAMGGAAAALDDFTIRGEALLQHDTHF